MTRLDMASTKIPWDELNRAAINARARAYAPYSRFLVGAAVLAPDHTIHAGANIENASYGLTLCAERVAMAHAVMAGYRSIGAIAVATDGGVAPCGACRQFLVEFAGDAPVALIDTDKENAVTILQLAELLPHQFSRSALERGL